MRNFLILSLSIFLFACQQQTSSSSSSIVKTNETLYKAIESAEPGTQIILANGIWKDVNIEFTGNGTEKNPIILSYSYEGRLIYL